MTGRVPLGGHSFATTIRWPTALLRALRSGQQRIATPALRVSGTSYGQIRAQLDRLPWPRRLALLRAAHCGLAQVEPPLPPFIDAAMALWRQVAQQRALPRCGEAVLLDAVGRDRFGRRHWLQPAAASAWRRLQQAAAQANIALELVSSFRSVRDQMRILYRKRRAGQEWTSILAVNAPPGYSEHHSGCAVDLAVAGEPVLTEAFEHTTAFAWLQIHAQRFGFALSYPRDNASGFIYEPWHWCYRGELRPPTLRWRRR